MTLNVTTATLLIFELYFRSMLKYFKIKLILFKCRYEGNEKKLHNWEKTFFIEIYDTHGYLSEINRAVKQPHTHHRRLKCEHI